MGKKNHHVRRSLKSFFQKHADPEKHEKLKESRKDIEEKKKKILNLLESHDENDGNQIHESKKGPITELLEEFHKHYESLFSHYDHLTGKLKDKVDKHQLKKETFSSDSDSGSDSEHDDSTNGKDGNVENDILPPAAIDGLQKELEAATTEVTDLKTKLAALSNEKAALQSDYMTMSSKIDNSERSVGELKVEADRLAAEKEELRMRVEIAATTEIELNQQIEELKRERDDLVIANEDAMKRVEDGNQSVESFKAEVDQLQIEKQSLELELGTAKQNVCDLEEELNSAKEESENLSKSLKKAVEEENKYREECKLLEDKISGLSHALAASHEGYREMIMNISENVNNSLTQMESIMTSKFEEDNDKLSNSIFKISEEIQVVKHCLAGKNIEREQLAKELGDVNERVKKQNGEMEELQRAVSQLTKAAEKLDVTLKEKDEQLSTLGEEKRQAIRQLCLWSDNLQGRYDELKSIVAKAASERRARR